jgi:hypothetical protein
MMYAATRPSRWPAEQLARGCYPDARNAPVSVAPSAWMALSAANNGRCAAVGAMSADGGNSTGAA